MPIEESGGFCDYCQRPVLGRRQGVNHVLYAILTIFSCGIWGLVWLVQVLAGGGDYACPNCGGRVREGARGPIPPPDPNAPPSPVPQNLAIKRALGVFLGLASLGAVLAIASWMGAEKRLAGPLPTASVATPATLPEVASETRQIVLTDSKEYQTERIATFRRALSDQSRECGKIASIRMKHRGAIVVWTVTCSPAKAYVLEYNAKGDLVGAAPANP